MNIMKHMNLNTGGPTGLKMYWFNRYVRDGALSHIYAEICGQRMCTTFRIFPFLSMEVLGTGASSSRQQKIKPQCSDIPRLEIEMSSFNNFRDLSFDVSFAGINLNYSVR